MSQRARIILLVVISFGWLGLAAVNLSRGHPVPAVGYLVCGIVTVTLTVRLVRMTRR